MSDANDNEGGQGGQNNGTPNGAGTGGRAPLTLKPRGGAVNTGVVRQSFSHGRSKTVVVETKRRREGERPPVEVRRPAAPVAVPAAPRAEAPAPRPAAPASNNLNLSQSELAARQRALDAARAAADARAADEARQRAAVAAREAAAKAAAAAAAEAARAEAARNAPPPAEAPAAEKPTAPVVTEARAPEPVESRAPEVRAPEPRAPQQPARPFGAREVRRDEQPASPPRPAGRPDPRNDGRTPEGRVYEAPRREGSSYPERNARPAGGGAPPQADRGPRPAGGGYAGGGQGYDRGPRPAGGADRGPRPAGSGYAGGGGDRPRPAAPGETVRYSALAPRPSGPRPTGGPPRGGAAAPSAPEITKTTRTAPPRTTHRPAAAVDDDESARRRGGPGAKKAEPAKAVSRGKGEPKRREGRLTIQVAAGGEGSDDRMRSLASVRRAREREREKRARGLGGQETPRVVREVVIPDAITVQELAQRMATRGVDIIKFMMRQGAMMTINDVLDADTAELIASEFGHEVKRVSESDVETGFISEDDRVEDTQPRPPVVAVMGHVDHGKTSLLDALRSADVAGGEHGGITQHIGAYQVRLPNDQRVTFLDTPGHAAFSAMRARGANVTDIVVLVVAADDGVMPQTIEAINHAKAADAPIIVAINKMDKPDADPTRVINELLQHEIVVESLGGDVQVVEVSATKKMGLENLLESILIQAEVMDLRANPVRSAEGVVIESKLDKGRGPVATVLVKRGSLKRGDIVVAGAAWGRVRALINERDEQVKDAEPSTPVEILGLDQTPDPGETFAVVENEARARELTEYRERLKRDKAVSPITAGASLADMMAKLQSKKVSELPLIIKADAQGSAEAIVSSLDKLGTDEVRARIIHSAAGAITESDVMLAKGANCSILGFNVRASRQARDLAEREGVEIRYYAIIYDLIDDIKGVLSGMLAPIQRETFLGNAEVQQTFDITKIGRVAGCKVVEGVVRKGAKVRIIRDDVVIQEMGTLQTLKRFKDEVNEVQVGQECGMAFQNFQDLKAGDQIECFTVETIQRSL
jgi:translation initiation factor IF-2